MMILYGYEDIRTCMARYVTLTSSGACCHMATVTFSFFRLVKLIGKDVSLDRLRADMFELGSETEAVEGDEVTLK